MSGKGGVVAGGDWIGGNGASAADAMWDSMWRGSHTGVPAERVTEGPLAEFPDGYDPIAVQRELRNEYDHEKVARVLSNDNDFDSPVSPGSNRVLQGADTDASGRAVVEQDVNSAKGTGAGAPGAKKDSAPSTGSRGGDLMRRLKAKGQGDPTKAETGTRSVGQAGEAKEPGHNLQVKGSPPVPKEMDPGRKPPENLAAYHGQSAWTGSGPQAALHNDYQKVGELVTGLLDVAGVPPQSLSESSVLMSVAKHVATAELSKTADIGYLGRDDIHPLKLVAEITDMLGDEWVGWEPETIRDTLEKEAGFDVSDDVMAKVMAVKIVLAAPHRFYDDWQAMEKISVALNDVSPTMGVIEDVPAEWLSNAVTVVEKIAGPGDFGPEVAKYVAARLFDQGYVVAPPKLAFADPVLGDMVDNDALREKVILAYAQALNEDEVQRDETPVSIQVSRLMLNHLYVLEKLDDSGAQLT